MSSFCKKQSVVMESFHTMCKELQTKWIFISYSSESIVPKEKLIEICEQYGEVSVVERDYKRFKSYEYNEDKSIKEYLFCINKNQ